MDCNIILNKVIEYIEENLTNKIDYNELSKTVGISGVTLQKIFCFLTNTSLSEYIRKRRLSMAVEDLVLTNEKIIDIAIKYQYESSTSFGRAFYNMYACTPKEVRTKLINLKTFPKMNFNLNSNKYCELNYRIDELEEKILYGISTDLIELSDKAAIKSLWQSSEVEAIKKPNSKGEYYGIIEYHADYKMKYLILNEYEKTDFIKKVIPKTKWIIFRVNSKDQQDILEICDKIYNNWIETSNYNVIQNYIDLEIYYDGYCEYCIAIT